MNESDLDDIYKILMEGYAKSLSFASAQCREEDIKGFSILFTEGLRESLSKVKSVMLNRALEGRSE